MFDGNYDEAIETVYHTSSSLSLTGTHLFSIRLRDENNNWGPTYKRTVYLGGNPRDIKITSGSIIWTMGTPVTLLVFDGNYNEAIESLYLNGISLPVDTGNHSI